MKLLKKALKLHKKIAKVVDPVASKVTGGNAQPNSAAIGGRAGGSRSGVGRLQKVNTAGRARHKK